MADDPKLPKNQGPALATDKLTDEQWRGARRALDALSPSKKRRGQTGDETKRYWEELQRRYE